MWGEVIEVGVEGGGDVSGVSGLRWGLRVEVM